MIESLITGIGGVLLMLLLWIAVQRAWGYTFAEHISDEDVLAERRSCSNCGCTTVCRRKAESI